MKPAQRTSLILFFLIGLLSNLKAQELVRETFYSESANDSIEIKIWLPENYASEKSYPVIYEFVYDHSDYIAATLKQLFHCPSTLVVHASFNPGTSYAHPNMTPAGEGYYQFVKDELIPHIERRYKTLHRTAIGLSQGADYVNYILRTNPELFQAYMIYAIESPNYDVNYTEYTNKLQEEKDYFIAIANDTEKRVAFANDLHENLSKHELLNVVKTEYKTADHSYAILYGLADGLLFTYKDYTAYRNRQEGETFSQYFTNTVNEVEERFGTIKYNAFLGQAFSQATKEDPKAEIEAVLENLYHDKINITDLDLFNLGYMLFKKLGYNDLAESTFEASIERGKMLSEKERRMRLSDTYMWLASVYYVQKKYDEIFTSLETAYEITQVKKLLTRYATYSFLVGDEYQVKKGIEALDTLVNLPVSDDTERNPDQPEDAIYLLYSKGYLKLKDENKSRDYLEMSLTANPNNEKALKFKESLK